jgi:peroxiredoxin
MTVQVGAPAPDFTLPDFQGVPFTLSKHVGKHLVLVFNRGFL